MPAVLELFGKTFQVAEITEYVAPITELTAGRFIDKVHKRIGQNGQEQGSVSITAELIGCCAVQVPFAFEDIGAARTVRRIRCLCSR